ncbi:MAG: VanW family protein [Candidatus Komeilibacteria bacterium]|nr:VanW family protein [Candidatus Komeilibacteria bacterium]
MAKATKTKLKLWRRRLAIFFSLLILALLIAVVGLWSQHTIYAAKFFPNTSLGPVNLSNLDLAVAEYNLNQAVTQFKEAGLLYQVDSFNFKLDLDSDFINLDQTTALSTIWEKQHPADVLNKTKVIITSLLRGFHYDLPWQLDQTAWQDQVTKKLGSHVYSAQPPRLSLTATGSLEVNEEVYGQVVPWPEANLKTITALANLDPTPIVITLQGENPEFTVKDISQELWNQLNTFILPQKNLTLVAEKKSAPAPIFPATKDSPFIQKQNFIVTKADWINWLEINPKNQPPLTINQEALNQYLIKNLSAALEQKPDPANIELASSSKATKFSPGLDGWRINLDQTLKNIEESWLNQGSSTIPVSLDRLLAATFNETLKNLGITELLGVGQSNFKGSPSNRRHNIATGAKSLQGLIIKPGEEFSLIEHLLPVASSTGYLQELVIKGDKTIPEYGGGLCQVGTTLFRATIAAGLPVLERRNHSYRVVYYEPAGTDATIYDPKPDYRFKNDTAGKILIWTRIKGDSAYFEFWGTSDGRVASQTTPYVYNVVSPGPSKLIITPNLKPGEKKCTEKAHAGADAKFTYTITYASGSSTKQTFSSHYIPWPEVCLIGATSTPALEDTSTPVEGAFISDLNQKP